jgi:hypothetical protein
MATTSEENLMMTTGGFGLRASGANPDAQEYVPLVDRIMAQVRGEALEFQNRHFLWPPEMIEYACDLHLQWVDDLIKSYKGDFESFVATATKEDFDTLLSKLFTEAIWTGNRRAFFAKLHDLALSRDAEGKEVSAALVAFYRTRYNPSKRFRSEQ